MNDCKTDNLCNENSKSEIYIGYLPVIVELNKYGNLITLDLNKGAILPYN